MTLYSELWGDGRYHASKCGRLRSYVFKPTSGPGTIEVTASGLVAMDDVTMSIAELEDMVNEAKRVEHELNKEGKK